MQILPGRYGFNEGARVDWFTSDWHLGHTNIVGWRGFDTVDTMAEAIITNMLAKLDSGDSLYILGDLAWGRQQAMEALKTLNDAGIIVHWVLGNHDHRCAPYTLGNLAAIHDSLVLPGNNAKPSIHLCHYPMRVWYNSFRGGWHLYGHVHQFSLEREVMDQPYGKCLNVNVEYHDYFPLSTTDIALKMAELPDNFDHVLLREKNK